MPIKPEKYKIDKKTGCWNWLLALDKDGYGLFTIRKGKKTKTYRAARYYYEKYRNKIPKDLCTDHLCQNKLCVNPYHLETVSLIENLRRRKNVKLSEGKAKIIKNLYNSGFKQTFIGNFFDIQQCTVSRVVNSKRWKSLQYSANT